MSTWLCGSRHLAIDEPKAKSELSTAAYSRSEARAVSFQAEYIERLPAAASAAADTAAGEATATEAASAAPASAATGEATASAAGR